MTGVTPQRRRAFLDWARGLAVLWMVEHHSFDAWMAQPYRGGALDHTLRFIGGLAAPGFLFLAGFGAVLGLSAQVGKGAPVGQAARRAARRGGVIVLAAFLFRFQEWALAFGGSPASDLWRVDILNTIGIALSVIPFAWAAFPSRARAIGLGAVALALMWVAPAVYAQPGHLPALVEAYLRGAPPSALFPVFPWVAVAFAGAAVGAAFAQAASLAAAPGAELRALGGAALGLTLAAGVAHALEHTASCPWPQVGYWTASPACYLMRTGLQAWLLLAAFGAERLWARRGRVPSAGPLTWLGRHSLLVYWVHVDLAYGRWFWRSRGTLTPGQTALAFAALLLSMVILARVADPAKAALRAGWSRLRSTKAATPTAAATGAELSLGG